jgi:hypothetical protein
MAFRKDPDAVLDYKWDWSAWLAAESDAISTSTFLPVDGLTFGTGGQSPTHDSTTATVWLSGGTVGSSYEVTNRITTTGGRTDDRTARVDVVAL